MGKGNTVCFRIRVCTGTGMVLGFPYPGIPIPVSTGLRVYGAGLPYWELVSNEPDANADNDNDADNDVLTQQEGRLQVIGMFLCMFTLFYLTTK